MTRQRLKRSIKIIRRCAEEISHKTDSLTASEEWIRDNLYFIEEQAEGVLGGLRYADLLFKECEALLYEDLNVDKVHKLIKDLDIDEEKLWSVVPTVKACAIIKIAENINGESVGDYVTFLRRITIEDFSQTVKDSSKLQQELLRDDVYKNMTESTQNVYKEKIMRPCICTKIPVGNDLTDDEVVLVFGTDSIERMNEIKSSVKSAELLKNTVAFWEKKCVKIQTGIKALDNYINGWAVYQIIACRIYARTSLYQCGGAYGFRDQLQDACAIAAIEPELLLKQIIKAAEHQYVEGDVQHWWHELKSYTRGVRTRCTDDLLWLPYAVCRYIENTGDYSVLEKEATYLNSRSLEEMERYEIPQVTELKEPILNHCKKAIDLFIKRGTGEHGLSLIGTCDWNDGFNLVGAEGKGESVWLSLFGAMVLKEFSKFCPEYNDYAQRLKDAVEKSWDGHWYRRGYYDDGRPLGSAQSTGCQIDSLSQSFACFCRLDKERVDEALSSALYWLLDEDSRIVKLFTPAFSQTDENPGYIKGYRPGTRENGGQYTHAAIWLAQALLQNGMKDEGYKVLDALLPQTHDSKIYGGEPYVLAADVYASPAQDGKAGWTWYTGAAGWYFRVVLEELLGIKIRDGKTLEINPKLPTNIDAFTATLRIDEGEYGIVCKNKDGKAEYPLSRGRHIIEI